MPVEHILEIIGALALGGFIGFDRRLAGALLAVPCHAAVAAAGLALSLALRLALVGGEDDLPGIIGGIAFVCAAVAMRAVAEEGARPRFGQFGDAFSLGSAVGVGASLGAGNVRAVELAMLAAVAIAVFRPRDAVPATVESPVGVAPVIRAGAAADVETLANPTRIETPIFAASEAFQPKAPAEPEDATRAYRPWIMRDARSERAYLLKHRRATAPSPVDRPPFMVR